MTERRAARLPAARPFVRYRLPVALSLVALGLLGSFAFGRLPMDFRPPLETPRLRVQVFVPGLTPTVLENKVMRPVEGTLLGTPGVDAVESVATPGSVTVELYLRHDRDADAVQQEVAARLERLKAILPAAIAPPVLSRIDASLTAAELAVTSRDRDALALRDWVDGDLAKRLRALPGVATVEATGGAVREIVVLPDQRRLAGFGIGFGDVVQALQKGRQPEARIATPAITHRRGREAMQSGNVAAVAAMPVILPSGESIPLLEVADVTLGEEYRAKRASPDDAETVTLTVQNQSQAPRADVSEHVRAEIDWMRANRLIPDGIEVHFLTYQHDEARLILKRLIEALAGGTLLALLVAYFILGSGRRTRILAVILVVSVQTAFVGMWLMGVRLNSMTLGALAVASGLLGACGILMFEHARPGAGAGASASPVITALTLPVALVSLAFAGGQIAVQFREFVLVLSGVWIVSALLAWTVVPAFDTVRRRARFWPLTFRRVMQSARRRYRRLLDALLRRPYALPVLAALFVGAMVIVFSASHRQIAPAFTPAPGEAMVWRLHGPDGARLAALGDDLAQRLRALPGLSEVRNSARRSREEFVLHLDDTRAGELGLDIADVGRALAIAQTGISAGSIRDADHRYDIRMRLPPRESEDAAARGRILLLGELEDRPAVYLRDVATVERSVVPAELRRENGRPEVRVTAALAKGAVPRRVAAEMRRALEGYRLPPGYEMSGDGVEDLAVRDDREMRLPALALLFVFAALMWRQWSWRVTIPVVACAGIVAAGVAALMLNLPLPIGAWFGAVLAIGIAAFYAMAFVTPIEVARRAGALTRRSLAQTASDQLRPLLKVTLMAIAGMIPMMLLGATVAVLRPVIIIVTASLILAFLASVLFIPPLYFLLTRREQSSAQSHL